MRRTLQEIVATLFAPFREVRLSVNSEDDTSEKRGDDARHVHGLGQREDEIGGHVDGHHHLHSVLLIAGETETENEQDGKTNAQEHRTEQKVQDSADGGHPVCFSLHQGVDVDHLENHDSDCIVDDTLAEDERIQERLSSRHVHFSENGQCCHRVNGRYQGCEHETLTDAHVVTKIHRKSEVTDDDGADDCAQDSKVQDVLELRAKVTWVQRPPASEDDDRQQHEVQY
mmetsp:Transcript_61226/g.162763  ORF Transcript_61226/g.162763 Transcript_61226/m.162763 type:complete len:228 (+) Transcript_61226:659-1342(+)